MTLAQETRKRVSVDTMLLLLTIEHADLEAPIRVVRNDEDIVSDGETFYAYPFEFLFEARGEDSGGESAVITVDNVAPELIGLMRSSRVSPEIRLDVVMASSPDDYEQTFEGMTLRNVEYDAERIDGIIARPQLMTQVAPWIGFTQMHFPGIV